MDTQVRKLCGSRVFKSENCHNRIRKISQNKFERVYLTGKHAFSYSVIIENIFHNDIKEIKFPTRKEALCHFNKEINKYN